MGEFIMPKLGADMSEGRLVSWRKKPGDIIQRGDIIAEVETDKGVIDVEIFNSGILTKLLVEPGQMIPVGTPLAIVQTEGEPEQFSKATPESMPIKSETTPPTPIERETTSRPLPAIVPRLAISPAARRLARELGIDPKTVQGAGTHGVIGLEDIRAAAAGKQTEPVAPATIARAMAMRQAIAAAMSRSKREIPHYYLSTTIDMHRAMTWLAQENQRLPITGRLLYGALLLKAVALSLRESPELNASWVDGRVVENPRIHVGVAVSLRQGGLIAPALHNTDQLAIHDLMQKFRELVQRARGGALRSSEISDPTITVTSLGEQGVENLFAVIYPPQVAIVGFGKVVERPWSVDGQVVSRPLITATLSADHRVSDGHRGARMLSAIDRFLQEPEKL